jgi:hypothetical protein
MLDYTSRYVLPNLDHTLINDPELAKMVEVSKSLSESDAIKDYRLVRELLQKFRYVPDIELGDMFQPFERYPLLSSLSRNMEYTHGIYYVNAVYDKLYG